MIDVAISHIVTEVNQHLMHVFDLNEDVVVVSNILDQDGTVTPHVNSKIVVSLVNIEKDNTPFQRQINNSTAMRSLVTNPPVHLNLYLMFSSNFNGNNYPEGLKFISNTIRYFQSKNTFDRQNSPAMDRQIDKLILNIENLSLNDLSNLWGVLSGKYLPSVLYKVRMITIDANAVKGQAPAFTKPETNFGLDE
jgi:hypothetical protein